MAAPPNNTATLLSHTTAPYREGATVYCILYTVHYNQVPIGLEPVL